MEPDKTQETPQKRTSRLRNAWRVLRGEPVVPSAIRAEWVGWQIEFENLLDKISAAAARAYERDRVKLKAAEKEIKELEARAVATDNSETAVPTWGGGGSWHPEKRAMNRLMLEKRGIRLNQPVTNGVTNVPGAEE